MLTFKAQRTGFTICTFIQKISLLFLLISATGWGYISGEMFKKCADFVFDEYDTSFDPTAVADGNIIFVKTEMLEQFIAEKLPQITERFLLITHNSDYPAPGPCISLFDDPRIIAWFGQNMDQQHPKFHPIPIGIANSGWQHGNTQAIDTILRLRGNTPRKTLLYMNFLVATNPKRRLPIYNFFAAKPFCTVGKQKTYIKYLADLVQAKFTISPPGNGIDCHRIWESIYVGTIPIIESSSMDPLLEGLPVLIIHDWNEVTEEFLERVYPEIMSKEYNLEKLELPYWKKEMDRCIHQ